MSDKYRMMIYFAVATMHLYRASIRLGHDDLRDFKRRNQDLILRICAEARNLFDYELSTEQMDKAIIAYLSAPQTVQGTEAATLYG